MGKWLCEIGGQRKGPFNDQQLREMAREGRLSAADKIWNPTGKRWELAGRLPGLFPTAAAGADGNGDGAHGANGAHGAADNGGTAAAAAAAMSAAAVQVAMKDDGPFLGIGRVFAVVKGSSWSGAALASHAAIYLLKVQVQPTSSRGGLVGALAAAALADYDDVRSCKAAELPPKVLRQLDPRAAYPNADVIILPRDAVTNVKSKVLSTGVTVRCGGDAFDIPVSLFRLGAVKTFLRAGGWSVNDEVQPTAPAVHGRSFGRAAPGNPAAPLPWERVVYALLALLVFLVLAYFKFETRRARNGW